MLTLISTLSRLPYSYFKPSSCQVTSENDLFKNHSGENNFKIKFSSNKEKKKLISLLSKSDRGAITLEKTARIVMLTLSLATIALGAIALAGALPLGSTGAIVMVVVGGAITGDALVAMLVGLYCDRPAYRLCSISHALSSSKDLSPQAKVFFKYSKYTEIIFERRNPNKGDFYPRKIPVSKNALKSDSEED